MTAPAIEGERPDEEKSPRGANILLVDDDGEARETIAMILEVLGYRVIEADSGPAALEVAARVADEIDLLLTDVRMPGMSGVELASRLSARQPVLPVLFVSGYTADALKGDGLSPRASFLPKPFSVDDLDGSIRRALAGS